MIQESRSLFRRLASAALPCESQRTNEMRQTEKPENFLGDSLTAKRREQPVKRSRRSQARKRPWVRPSSPPLCACRTRPTWSFCIPARHRPHRTRQCAGPGTLRSKGTPRRSIALPEYRAKMEKSVIHGAPREQSENREKCVFLWEREGSRGRTHRAGDLATHDAGGVVD